MPRLVFDTSVINWLAEDEDRKAILEGLRLSCFVLITETSISEILADRDIERRNTRLDVLKFFLNFGICIMPFSWTVEEQMKAYFRDPHGYDWSRLDIRFREGERELARQEFMHTLSEETFTTMKDLRKDFANIYKQVRPDFRKAFGLRDDEPAPPFQDVAQALLAQGGPHFELAKAYIENITGSRGTPDQVRDFMERCPPFAALMVAVTLANYDYCMRSEREPWITKKASREDLLSAAYLPYCQRFVTSDEGQCKALAFISDWTKLNIPVVLYDEFKKSLFGIQIQSSP